MAVRAQQQVARPAGTPNPAVQAAPQQQRPQQPSQQPAQMPPAQPQVQGTQPVPTGLCPNPLCERGRGCGHRRRMHGGSSLSLSLQDVLCVYCCAFKAVLLLTGGGLPAAGVPQLACSCGSGDAQPAGDCVCTLQHDPFLMLWCRLAELPFLHPDMCASWLACS